MRAFLKDVRGNVAMMFGLMMIGVIFASGMAVDFIRKQNAQTIVQNAADAAALRAAVLAETNGVNVEDAARSIFMASIGNSVKVDSVIFSAVETAGGTVLVNATAHVKPMFIQVAGPETITIDVISEASLNPGKGIELVIAFDTTSSMGFDDTWDTALVTLQDVLEQLDSYTGAEDFYVTLVPFSDRVPVGVGKTAWLDAAAPAGWNGCVEPREEVDGAFQWALDDDSHASEKFAASIPGVTGGVTAMGVNLPVCPSVAVTGPTNNVSTVITAAGNLATGGTGRFDVAMAWSWRLLSPKWSGLWGVSGYPALNTDDRRKAVIFVTDGRTEAYTHELSQTRSWGFNEGSIDGFENMVHVCDQMKNDDIEIFMFRINGNIHAEAYMQDCASSYGHYQAINSNAELAVAFEGVVSNFEDVRIIR